MAKGLLVWLMDGCDCVREGLMYTIMRFNGLSYANRLFNSILLCQAQQMSRGETSEPKERYYAYNMLVKWNSHIIFVYAVLLLHWAHLYTVVYLWPPFKTLAAYIYSSGMKTCKEQQIAAIYIFAQLTVPSFTARPMYPSPPWHGYTYTYTYTYNRRIWVEAKTCSQTTEARWTNDLFAARRIQIRRLCTLSTSISICRHISYGRR